MITTTALYRLFDSTGRLLYVGITGHPIGRVRQHMAKSPWWSEVDSGKTEIKWYTTREEAELAERSAISQDQPAYNVVGTSIHAERSRAASLAYYAARSNEPMDPYEFANRYAEAMELTNNAERARAFGVLLAAVPELQKLLRGLRQDEVEEMRASGMTDAQIGEELGIHWARVSAIARGVSAGGNDAKRKRPA